MGSSPGRVKTCEKSIRRRAGIIGVSAFLLTALAQNGFGQTLPAPTGLKATSGNGLVDLYWTPIPSASPTCYFIYRDPLGTPTNTLTVTPTQTPTPIGSYTPVVSYTSTPVDTPTGTSTPLATVLVSSPGSFIDYQVANGVSYVYSVMGLDLSGNLGSPATAVANPFAPPEPIQTITVQALHAGALDLSWPIPLSSYPVTGYSIYRLVITFTFTPTGSPSPVPTSTPTSSFTPVLTCTPTQTFQPGTFTNTPANTCTSTVSLTPTNTGTSTQTFIPTHTFMPTPYLASTVISQGPPLGYSPVASYSDQLQNSGPGEYYYVVIGMDDQGNSSPITYLVTATPGTPVPVTIFSSFPNCPQFAKPLAPSLSGGVIATLTPPPGGNNYGVILQWSGSLQSESVTTYQVLSNGTPIATEMVTQTPYPTYGYIDQTIPYSASQTVLTQYSVIASNGNGSVTSNTLSENIYQPNMNNGSIQVTPVATTNAVTVSWNPGVPGTYGLSGYLIFKSTVGLPIPTGTQSPTPTPLATYIIPAFGTPTLVYTDSGVTNANGISYWVQPYATLVPGGVIASSVPAVLDLGPTPVFTVSAAATLGNNAFAVTWAGGGTAGFYGTPVAYEIFRENVASTPKPIATVSYAQSSYTDYAVVVTPSTNMSYQISALDSLGNLSDLSAPSNTVESAQISTLKAPIAPMGLPVVGGPSTLVYSWLWNPATDLVTAYNLYGPDYLSYGPTTPTPTPLAVYLPTITYTPTFVAIATPWVVNNYYVVAQNATGFSSPTTLSSLAVSQYSVSAGIPIPTQAVTVSWNLVNPTISPTPLIDSYDVYRSVTQGAQFTPLAIVPYPTMSYSDTTASAGQSVYYRVTARSKGIESSLYPYMTPPPESGVLTWPNGPASFTANGAISLTTLYWASSPGGQGVTSYSIYQNGNLTPVATLAVTVSPSPTVYSVVVADTPGAGTGYQVVAQNSGGVSAASVSVLLSYGSAQTFSLTPPVWVSPTPNATQPYAPGVWVTGFTFNSTPTPNGVNSYVIYRSIYPTPASTCVTCWSNEGTVSAPVSLSTTTPVWEDVAGPYSGPVSGYINYYQIIPQNGFGLQGNPNPQTSVSITYFPAAPISLTALPSASVSNITLAWAPGGDAPVTGYDVYRSTYPFVPVTFFANPTSGGPASTYTDNSVTNGFAYFYWVSSEAQGVTGAPASVAALAVTAPTLYNTPGAAVNNLAWNPVVVPTGSPVSGYSLESIVYPATPVPSVTPAYSPIVPAIIEGIDNTTYADASVSDPNSYSYQVAAAAPNPWGGSPILGPFSNPVTVTVLPLPVINLEAVSGDGLVQLRWNYQGNQKFSYTIQRKLGSAPVSDYQTIKTVQGINYADSGVFDKTLYDYQVYSVDGLGLTSSAVAVQALPAEPPYVGNTTVSLLQNQEGNQTGNILSWAPANYPPGFFDPTKMYPLGGYYIYRSSDGGGTYELVGSQSSSEGATQNLTYFDPVKLVDGSANTYLIWAFDAPAGVNTSDVSMVHESPYTPVTAFPLTAGAALDLNAIRPNSTNAQVVHVRFVVTQKGKVDIKVYSLTGTFIKEIFENDNVPVGVWGLPGSQYSVSWNGRNMAGNLVASGVYLVTVEMNGHQEIDKVAVIK